jgi:hypothetical protein
VQVTKRGFRTAAEARRELLSQVSTGRLKPTASGTTINELLDLYLDGLDAAAEAGALGPPPLDALTSPGVPGPHGR